MASLVENCVDNSESFVEIDWENTEVLESLYRFSRISLLHRYIFSMISVEERHEYRENDDIYEESEEARSEIEQILTIYGIDHYSYSEFVAKSMLSENDYCFWEWFVSQEDRFELLWEKIADEVFHLLFANRSFLLRFNQSLADFLRQARVTIPPRLLDGKGVIKRQNYVPTWAKKAVFYRDHGRCVLCQRDLTGLIGTDRQLHYDHIVPLNLWGVNDPCNLQLLCEDCNLRKSGNKTKTAFRYPAWWDY